jgi:FtsH-binding integral membrane protein
MANQHVGHAFGPGGANAAPSAPVAAGLRTYLVQVYNYMAAGLALTGAVAYYGAASGFYASIAGTPFLWVVVFAPLALVLFLGFRIERISLGAAQISFWAYAGLVGLSLSGIFLVYTGESVARVFFISAGTFAATSLYGYTTRRDLSRFGSFLFMGLIGIIIAGLVNMFLKSSTVQLTISAVGVIVFVGLTAYDTQRIKALYIEGEDGAIAGKKAILGALALYLDFLNLFLMLMQLLGNRRR